MTTLNNANDTNIQALITEILKDYTNGYEYFEYPINYGVWSGDFVLEGQVLLLYLHDEDLTHEMTATTDIINFTNGNIIDVEQWVNTNLFYNTIEI